MAAARRRYRGRGTWRIDAFMSSLTSVADSTRVAYRGDLDDFVRWAERAGLDGPEAVTRLVLRRYLSYLTTLGRKKRTIARRAAALRRYFGWLRRTAILDVDPSVRLTAPAGEGRLPHVLSRGDVEELLDDPSARADGGEPALRLRDDAVLELLYGSGLRVAELCGLRRNDVDLAQGLVTVLGKGSKERQGAPSPPPGGGRPAGLGRGRGRVGGAPFARG